MYQTIQGTQSVGSLAMLLIYPIYIEGLSLSVKIRDLADNCAQTTSDFFRLSIRRFQQTLLKLRRCEIYYLQDLRSRMVRSPLFLNHSFSGSMDLRVSSALSRIVSASFSSTLSWYFHLDMFGADTHWQVVRP